MIMPRFTAEASLNVPTKFYRTLPTIDGQIQRTQVFPQMTTLTFETTRGCNLKICTLTMVVIDRRLSRAAHQLIFATTSKQINSEESRTMHQTKRERLL